VWKGIRLKLSRSRRKLNPRLRDRQVVPKPPSEPSSHPFCPIFLAFPPSLGLIYFRCRHGRITNL
jgi:hypothetical protein